MAQTLSTSVLLTVVVHVALKSEDGKFKVEYLRNCWGKNDDWLIGASLSSYHEKATVRYALDESAPA